MVDVWGTRKGGGGGGGEVMVYVAPNDPDRQLRGSSSGMRRSTPTASDEREPNSRAVCFPQAGTGFPQFLKIAGHALGLSTAPARAFVPLEGFGETTLGSQPPS